MIMHASRSIESIRAPSADERRAAWAAKFYMYGHHHQQPRAAADPHGDDPQPEPDRVRGAGMNLVPVTRTIVDDETGEVCEIPIKTVTQIGAPF